jgi:hypothetical protein
MVLLLALLCAVTPATELSAATSPSNANRKSAIANDIDAVTIPRMLSYQGLLTDTAGVPVPNGNYSVAFKLYTVPSGGSPFWNETQNVATRDGLFAVLLGAVTPIGAVPDAGALYLGMAVASGGELAPRLRIVSAAYAYKADTAQYALASPSGGVGGSGVAGRLARWVGTTTLGSSSVQDDTANHIAVGASPNSRYRIYGYYSSTSYGALGLEDAGVYGSCSVDSGSGVRGYTGSATGAGVSGRFGSSSYGYLGERYYGVRGDGPVAGVRGSSSQNGVEGANEAGGLGILGCSSPVYAGVYGISDRASSYGVYGTTSDTLGSAVYGLALGYNSVAIRGFTGASSNTAVEGISGSGTGVRGQGSIGVSGFASGSGTGVRGEAGTNGIGVEGIGSGYGVKAATPTGTAGVALYGESQGTYGYGLRAIADNTGGYGAYGTSNNGRGGYFRNNNNSYYALSAVNASGSGSTVRGLYVQGHGYASGGWQTDLGDGRTGFGVVSPEMDVVASGSGELRDGVASVAFERSFSDAIARDVPLKVIVTPTSDCGGVFVAGKSATGFQVRELAGGKSAATFDWIAIGMRGDAPAPSAPRDVGRGR